MCLLDDDNMINGIVELSQIYGPLINCTFHQFEMCGKVHSQFNVTSKIERRFQTAFPNLVIEEDGRSFQL